jgi:hypothetical protein
MDMELDGDVSEKLRLILIHGRRFDCKVKVLKRDGKRGGAAKKKRAGLLRPAAFPAIDEIVVVTE